MMQKKPTMNERTKLVFKRRKRFLFVSACVILIAVLFLVRAYYYNSVLAYTPNPNDNRNTLVYQLKDYRANTPNRLMVYDPRTNVSTPFAAVPRYAPVKLSGNNRVAFADAHEGNTEVYVLDNLSADSVPVNISQHPTAIDLPLAWSPDGRYLAFESYQSEHRKHLEIWDGTAVSDISPEIVEIYQADSYDVAWSSGNRLAFTLSNSGINDSEIYLWNGKETQILSQNPNGEDSDPAWSADGRLAFVSKRKGIYDILVWDGVLVKNGLPDKDSFISIAPGLATYYSSPTWTNIGQLAFSATDSSYSIYSQVLMWDGQTLTNLSQNAGLHNGSASWNAEGLWTFSNFFSSEQNVYVRNADNQTLFTAEGQSSAWSLGGLLMFCRFDRPDWVLLVWDGKEAHEVARGDEIFAQWQGGAKVACSSG